jgi:hypothetical protein
MNNCIPKNRGPAVKQLVDASLRDGKVSLLELNKIQKASRAQPMTKQDQAAVADLLLNQQDKMGFLARTAAKIAVDKMPQKDRAAAEVAALAKDGRITASELTGLVRKLGADGFSCAETEGFRLGTTAFKAQLTPDAARVAERAISAGDAFCK